MPHCGPLQTKLTQEIERGATADQYYVEALSVVLVVELARLNRPDLSAENRDRGGLAAWQRRAIEEQIEARLDQPLSVVTLAEAVRLSPRHFGRAFKESFEQPPHHYHLSRRVEQAKALLAKPEMSVTEIALTLGFVDTSAFSTTFRRFTGGTPSDYRRALV